jgi:hypothetical protein
LASYYDWVTNDVITAARLNAPWDGSGNLSIATKTIAATSITLGGGSALANYVASTTFTPNLSDGGGGTTPTYTAAAAFYKYTRIGDQVHVRAYFKNTSGGTAGAGAGQLRFDLPVTASANYDGSLQFPIGWSRNDTGSQIEYSLFGNIAASGTTISISYKNAISTLANFTAALQDNAVRIMYCDFWYGV